MLDIERNKSAEIGNSFEDQAAKALRNNNQAFFELANEKLEPLQTSLEKLDNKVQEIEQARSGADLSPNIPLSPNISASRRTGWARTSNFEPWPMRQSR